MNALRSWFTVLPVSALVFSSCQKKEQPAPEAPAEAAQAVPAVTPAATPAVPAEAPAPVAAKELTAGERAAFLGIVGRLSKETESVAALYDGRDIVKRLKSLKTWEFINDTAKEEGTDIEEEVNESADQVGKFLGQEIFFAMGKGSTPQVELLLKLNNRSSYYQTLVATRSLVAGLNSQETELDAELEEDLDEEIDELFEEDFGIATESAMDEMFKELAKELPLIEALAVPPLLIGIKAQDAETLEAAQGQVAGILESLPESLGEGASPLEFSQGGVDFQGYKIAGSFFAEQLGADRESMEEDLDPADVDRLLEALKKKNVVVAAGALDNYLLLFVGGSETEVPLVEKVEDSLAASDELSFVDAYQGKRVAGLLYASEGLAKAGIVGTVKELALGVRDGLAGAEGLGDTRELASLLELIGEKEDALLALSKADATGGLAVIEEGVKLEFFGGVDRGSIDHSASRQLSNLGGGGDVLLFGNWVADAVYTERAREMGEALVETAYAIAEKVAGLELDEEGSPVELQQFQQGFQLFNLKFREDALALWEAVTIADEGLGREAAFVIDLKGKMPPLPGIPQELVDDGKFFRASLISPVTDRSKLKDSWTKIDGSLKNIFKSVSELAGEDIPQLKPMSSEKDGLVTWFFSMPLFTDDFVPSVTLNDKWYVSSTSKNQAVELVAAAEAGGAGDHKDAWFEIDFDVLRKFAGDWVDLVAKDGEAVFPNPDTFADFQEQLPRIKKGLDAFEEFDGLTVSERREDGKLRTSLHFKVR